MEGGAGIDTASYEGAMASLAVNLATGTGMGGDAAGDKLSNFENIISGDAGDALTGNSGANELYGGGGDDILAGGAGADKLDGGAANDTASYASDTAGVTISLATGAASGGHAQDDSLISIENVTGGAGNDTIEGDDGANKLSGGANGAVGDTLTYANANNAVIVSLAVAGPQMTGAGTDTISGFEKLTGSAFDDKLTGSVAVNTLIGLDGDDWLDGGAGADKLLGGAGNDTYVVDAATDLATEAANEGDDFVLSRVSYTLGANLENLTLTGVAAISGKGNEDDNLITGNGAANTLTGGAGQDRLLGGGGVDTASYALGTAGVAVSLMTGVGVGGDAEGDSLSEIENLTGGSGDDVLEGSAGANVLIGGASGAGGDTLSYRNAMGPNGVTVKLMVATAQVTGGAGSDTISGFEHLVGSNFSDNLTGTAGANVLTGLDGDDLLNGGVGIDTLLGGAGNDTYVVNVTGDLVTEASDEGDADLVQSSATFTLGDNIERLKLIGAATINGTGNELNNDMTGNAAANTLSGLDGDDWLDGGAGDDKLFGGEGNDTYVVDLAADQVTENAGEGDADTVLSAVSFTLGAHLENLTLTGAAAINGTGNALDNIVNGNSAANILIGGAGQDTLIGGGGVDTASYASDGEGVTVSLMTGEGAGGHAEGDSLSEIENLTGGSGDDTLEGNAGNNKLTGGTGNDTVSYENADNGVTVSLAVGAIQITGAGSDTLSGFERLIGSKFNDKLIGASTANVLIGLGGDDRLEGGGGVDKLFGGAGNDTYVLDVTGDEVTENADEGDADLVLSAASYTLGVNLENLALTGAAAVNGTGNELANSLTGNAAVNTLVGLAGDDRLDGGGGGDNLIGGEDNDTYVVDAATDQVTENPDEGDADLVLSVVNYTLGANLENLTLTGVSAVNGTGNEFDNVITGNAMANVVSGGAGNDTLVGGGGIDTASYAFDTAGVTVSLFTGTGSHGEAEGDILSEIENLTGGSGDDVLEGNEQNNVLIGGPGVDTVTYANADQRVVVSLIVVGMQATGFGNDTISSVENLIGSIFNDELVGSAGSNSLSGGIGRDELTGGLGADTLRGDSGNDYFRYTGPADGSDTILDFSAMDADKIAIIKAGFGIASGVALDAGDGNDFGLHYFVSGAAAAGSAPSATEAGHGQFLFNTTSRQLFWDSNGTGAGGLSLIASLNALLSATDFDLR